MSAMGDLRQYMVMCVRVCVPLAQLTCEIADSDARVTHFAIVQRDQSIQHFKVCLVPGVQRPTLQAPARTAPHGTQGHA